MFDGGVLINVLGRLQVNEIYLISDCKVDSIYILLTIRSDKMSNKQYAIQLIL